MEFLPTILNVVGIRAADEDKDDQLVRNITAEARGRGPTISPEYV